MPSGVAAPGSPSWLGEPSLSTGRGPAGLEPASRPAGHPVDVSDRAAVQAAMAAAADQRGPVDILVCSAGVAHPGYFEQLDDDVFRQMMEVDYFGTLWPIRAVVPSMIERGTGSIVGISSAAGIIGVFGYTAYGPAKFAVRGTARSPAGRDGSPRHPRGLLLPTGCGHAAAGV